MYQQWHTGQAQMKQALDGISKQLGSAATTYEQTESQLTSQLHG